MRRRCRSAVMVAAVMLVGTALGRAETIEKTGTFGGLTVHYKVILPNGFDPAREYPVILTFPGGGQEMRIVDGRLEANWRAEAERRSYIVVSPAAPDGHLFFEEGARAFPAFLDQILRDYKVRGGKLHVTGASNGGLSAFHIASLYPGYFLSVTGYPGMLPTVTPSAMAALKPLCIYMHVGDRDTGWLEEMRRQAEEFRRQGMHVQLTVERDQEHQIRSLAGAGAVRLFEHFEDTARGCR